MNQPLRPQSGTKRIISFPSDKNGCGYYRSIIPLSYLSARLDWDTSFLFQFVFDLNLIRSANWVRFQRQCTENQIKCVAEYRKCIDKTKSPAKLCYELDDLVHGIEAHNILAYQFYTPVRRQNVVDIMRMCHCVTFSTQFLKDFYDQQFGIKHSYVVPNLLPQFLWNPDKTKDKRPLKKKPVVFYMGSASHFGPGGDFQFMLPMIEATVDEFEWMFMGVCPPSFEGRPIRNKVSFVPWANFWDFPRIAQQVKADIAIAPLTDSVFNLAKSDLKLLEYAAMNIPGIYTSIGAGHGPYDLIKAPNLVPQDADAFYQAIKTLSTDESLRQKTLQRQWDIVETRWMESEENVQLYNRVYNNE